MTDVQMIVASGIGGTTFVQPDKRNDRRWKSAPGMDMVLLSVWTVKGGSQMAFVTVVADTIEFTNAAVQIVDYLLHLPLQ
jgi:hypothetical protein